ncbi:MAG: amidohydrolase family protein [Deltaproteobacteria bacterium]|nr:amidohydrolase family protein [Deltaproteobacteria bacterium]
MNKSSDISTSSNSERNDLLILNADLIDGTGASTRKNRSILIENGLITAIDKSSPVNGIRKIDAKGSTVMPGLIDAHVHLQSVPGSVYRDDSEKDLEKYRYEQLRAYLACGVTTVLDNAISSEMLKKFNNFLADGGTGPHIYALGPTFYPRNGYLDNGMLTPYWGPSLKPSENDEDVKSLFNEYENFDNIVGVKAMVEPGFQATIWPLHSPEMRETIVRESNKRNKPIYIHAYKKKIQKIGLKMGVKNFAHSGFLKGSPSNKFINEVLKQGTYLTTTLASTIEQMLIQFDQERLDDPLLKLTVSEEIINTAKDMNAWKDMYEKFIKNSTPKWVPSLVLKQILKYVNFEKQLKANLTNASKAIYKMYKAGIPIVLGTDTSNWPLFISFFHGISTIREIELLHDLGMLPIDIISSSTRIPAEMMGIESEVGTVETGKRADLVILKEDPLKNLSALRDVSWTIKDGLALSPKEWMDIK